MPNLLNDYDIFDWYSLNSENVGEEQFNSIWTILSILYRVLYYYKI